MASNIMNEYIKLTKEHMKGYMKIIFTNKLDNAIFEDYWNAYLNVRYYDLNGYKNDNTLKSEILSELETERDRLSIKKVTKEKIVQDMYTFYTHLIYFDRVSPNKDLEKTINDINELRMQLLSKEDPDFKDELRKLLNENTNQIDELLKKYESSDFYISISNYRSSKNVYRVSFKYNFRMPMVYSNFAINKALNTGTIAEDKLIIEYSLIVIQIIQDIIRGNFKKQYIVEFADTLFDKYQKMDRVLGIINNQAIQDKLIIKMDYGVFLKNKEEIFRLIQKGFKFGVVIDDKFEGTLEATQKLEVFEFILINENAKWYHHIVDGIDKGKIIEI